MNRATFAEIDLSAIAYNIDEIRKVIPKKTKIMTVVKANAYGHGAVEISKAAISSGVDYLSVATVSEALELREAGITAPILLLSESPISAAREVISASLAQTVYSVDLAKALSIEAAQQGKVAKVHVKVDTGMGRIGVRDSQAISLIKEITKFGNLLIEGIFTHFAKAEDLSDDYTRNQLSKFKKVIEKVESNGFRIPLKHAANSAATLYFPESHLDMIRIGLAMYGLYPPFAKSRPLDLHPALAFKTKVVYKKRVPKDTALSYGCTYLTPKETTIATLPVGYADGLSRVLSNRGSVLIRGKRYPIVGTVCMDLTLIDVGEDKVEVGDEVVMIGKQGGEEISVDEVAELEGTISYEVVCGIGKRVPRIYKKL